MARACSSRSVIAASSSAAYVLAAVYVALVARMAAPTTAARDYESLEEHLARALYCTWYAPRRQLDYPHTTHPPTTKLPH